MNPTNKPTTITLAGKEYKLFFDLNTFSAFEEKSGKFFIDFLATLQEAVLSALVAAPPKTAVAEDVTKMQESIDALAVLRRVSMRDIAFFLWAALHTYDTQGDPVWPFTVGQVGSMIDVSNAGTILPKILSATAANSPDAPKPSEDDAQRPTRGEQDSPQINGGSLSGPSDDAILSSLTPRSDG